MSELVVVGKITGAFGVRGWVKITSFTSPRDNLVDYRPWIIQGAQVKVSVSLYPSVCLRFDCNKASLSEKGLAK